MDVLSSLCLSVIDKIVSFFLLVKIFMLFDCKRQDLEIALGGVKSSKCKVQDN